VTTRDDRQTQSGVRRPSRWLLIGLAMLVVAIYAFTIWVQMSQQHG